MKLINLRQFRKERGLTQKQFGEAMQLSQSTVSCLENGLQEATGHLLDRMAKVFMVDNMDDYVYERKTYLDPESVLMTRDEKMAGVFAGDWNEMEPIDIIEGFPIICRLGTVSIGRDGTLLIDRNNGIGYKLSHYVIRPDKFEEPTLLLALTAKQWFDDEMYEDFKRAYFIGCKIADIYPMRQLKKGEPK